MSNSQLTTAVLFLVFNRLDTTKRVFDAIRKVSPPRLYIAADGPRLSHPDEQEKIQAVRSYVTNNIDWQCEVKTLFRDQNLGCKRAVESAITWFFDHEEMGIILEDDCLPSQSFFWFCESLLEKYKFDTRLMMISGFNKQGEWKPSKNDYFFSQLGGIWGWASWARAWKLYDPEMESLSTIISEGYLRGLLGYKLGRLREHQMIQVKSRSIDTWDYYWGLSRHANSGLSCVPSKNLIKNLGFGNGATHTRINQAPRNNSLHEINFPLKTNEIVIAESQYDRLFFGNNIIKLLGILFSLIRQSSS